MRSLTCFALLSFLAAVPAAAQRSLGYWFVAPGGRTADARTDLFLHMGGGGEIALGQGVSIGIEAGALGPKRNFSDNVFGLASLDGVYHFRHSRTARLDPFVNGGYSLKFPGGTANLGNVGAGLNYWFLRQVAFRAEFRDHIRPIDPTTHFWGFRMGLSFTSLEP
jgi:hypothetical protein